MANPLYSAMNSKMNSQTAQILNALKNGGNPMAVLSQSPQGRQILQMIQNGADPQALFYQECQKRGINPQDILNQLK